MTKIFKKIGLWIQFRYNYAMFRMVKNKHKKYLYRIKTLELYGELIG